MIINRLFKFRRERVLFIATSIIMTLMFIFEVSVTFLRVILPPLSGIGEVILDTLFLSIAIILTLYLYLLHLWIRGKTYRRQRRSPVCNSGNVPQRQNQRSLTIPELTAHVNVASR